MLSANQFRYSHGLRLIKAFDTNALQLDPGLVGRLCENADLLCALFEARGLTAQIRNNFAGEMK
jgi:hypothetical protein